MITVDEKLCKGCNLCTEFCPKKVYQLSGEHNKKGIHIPVPVDEDKCKKCGLCALLCPDQAIKVEEEEDE